MLITEENLRIRLEPPLLNHEVIAAKVACVRPMRNGSFQISQGEFGSKQIVHCYGHGGCGWTTLLGSVDRAIQLFARAHPDPEAAPPIRVIGAGCMGLCSAIELVRRGYRVTKITAERLYDIASWNAAGYFSRVSVRISPEEAELVDQINFFTFEQYRLVKKRKHPYFSSRAVRSLPVYCSDETHSGLEELEKAGLIPPCERVDLDFGQGVIHRNFKRYWTFFFDVVTFMKDLHREVDRLSIPIEQGKIHCFSEVEESAIFHCSGLGSQELAGDSKMIPVRGHLLVLHPMAGKGHMDYMIYTEVEQDGKMELIYMFPRTSFLASKDFAETPCSGILGGTLISLDGLSEELLAELDRRELERMLERNRRFFYGPKISLQGEVSSYKKTS